MSDELFYTSVPRGLRPGSSGFCTVAATAGLGAAWVERLEALSGYTPLFLPGDPRESENPVACSHVRVSVTGMTRCVLSRVGFSGFDHTGHSNKIAHHVVLHDGERPPGGPAWTMRQPDVMAARWHEGEPRIIPTGPVLPTARPVPQRAVTWEAVAGDAGWAGALAGRAAADPTAIVYLVYPADVDALALVDEALRLLPEPQRWQVTFSTFVTEPPAGVACAWRCVIAGTPAADLARGHVIDLTCLREDELVDSPYVTAARSGHAISRPDSPVAGASRAASLGAGGARARNDVGLRPDADPRVATPHRVRDTVPPVELQTTDETSQHSHGASFWMLAVGLPAVAACVAIGLAIALATGSDDPYRASIEPGTSRQPATEPSTTTAFTAENTAREVESQAARGEAGRSDALPPSTGPSALNPAITHSSLPDASPLTRRASSTEGQIAAARADDERQSQAAIGAKADAEAAARADADARAEDVRLLGTTAGKPFPITPGEPLPIDRMTQFSIEGAERIRIIARSGPRLWDASPSAVANFDVDRITFRRAAIQITPVPAFSVSVDAANVIHCDFADVFHDDLARAMPRTVIADADRRTRMIHQNGVEFSLTLRFDRVTKDRDGNITARTTEQRQITLKCPPKV